MKVDQNSQTTSTKTDEGCSDTSVCSGRSALSITSVIKILILFIIFSAALQNFSYFVLVEGFRRQTVNLNAELSKVLTLEPFSDVMQIVSDMEKSTASIQQAITWMTTGSLALALVLALWISKKILIPLNSLIFGLQNISLSTKTRIPESSAPEELLNAVCTFNSMATKLENAAEALEKTAGLRAAGETAAILAHEIKNPLSAAGLSLTALKRRIHGDQLEMALEIEEALQRIDFAVKALSDLARPTAVRSEPIDINGLLNSILTLTSRVAEKASTKLILNIDNHEFGSTDQLSMIGDREAAIQVLVNLVLNSIRATPEGIVEISVARADESILIRISDNGPGLPAGFDINNIQPFKSGFKGGIGLGLIVVKSACDSMGWKINTSASSPNGAVFELHVPIHSIQEG
jgi:signal transduction histidine kinase